MSPLYQDMFFHSAANVPGPQGLIKGHLTRRRKVFTWWAGNSSLYGPLVNHRQSLGLINLPNILVLSCRCCDKTWVWVGPAHGVKERTRQQCLSRPFPALRLKPSSKQAAQTKQWCSPRRGVLTAKLNRKPRVQSVGNAAR